MSVSNASKEETIYDAIVEELIPDKSSTRKRLEDFCRAHAPDVTIRQLDNLVDAIHHNYELSCVKVAKRVQPKDINYEAKKRT